MKISSIFFVKMTKNVYKGNNFFHGGEVVLLFFLVLCFIEGCVEMVYLEFLILSAWKKKVFFRFFLIFFSRKANTNSDFGKLDLRGGKKTTFF